MLSVRTWAPRSPLALGAREARSHEGRKAPEWNVYCVQVAPPHGCVRVQSRPSGRLFALLGDHSVRAWVYIDGFNLYRRAIRVAEEQGHGSFRWLNIVSMSQAVLSADTVERVKYFTALVRNRPNDPSQRSRQQTYWAALRTLPELEIIPGHFSEREARAPLWSEYQRLVEDEKAGLSVVGQRMKTASILKAEEKGSDVNLAVHLVNDAHFGYFEKALVVSNDSDLACAIRIVRDEIELPVILCNPSLDDHATGHLTRVASGQRSLRVSTLRECQLPNPVIEPQTGRAITKPAGW
jgi:hypothetical protein